MDQLYAIKRKTSQGKDGKSISTHGTHISVFNFLILWWFYAILFCLSYDVDEACHNPRFFEHHLHLNQKSDWSLRKEWIGRLCRGGWWTLRHLFAALVRNYSFHIIRSPVLEVSCSIFLHEGTWSPWLLPGRRKRTNSESARYMFHESFMPFSQCHEVEVLATPMLNIKAHSIICLEMIECQHHRRRTSCNLSGWKIHPRRPPDFLRFWEFHGSHGNVSRRDQSPNYLMCSHVQPSQRQKTDVACKTVTLTKKAVYIQHVVFRCAESVFQTDWTDLPRIIYIYT